MGPVWGKGGGVKWGLAPPVENFFNKIMLFSGFEVKNQLFLIVEGLTLCSIIYQILKISMASSRVYKKYTSNSFKMNDMSKLIKHVREAANNFCSSSVFSSRPVARIFFGGF